MDDNSDHNGKHHDSEDNLLGSLKRGSRSDEGREPQLVQGRLGTRLISFAALVERIVTEFEEEYDNDSPALKEAVTESEKLKLVRDTADYVIAVESADLTTQEKANVIKRVYADLFSYGPIDTLLQQDTLTTILIEGADKVSIRRAHNDLETLSPIFEDNDHLQKILNRMMMDAGVEPDTEHPILEFGLQIGGRPVAVNLVLPPVTYQITMDIRVHPPIAPTFHELMGDLKVDGKILTLIEAIVNSEHGVIIAGDTESGKTTFLTSISHIVPQKKIASIERSGELRLPDGASQFTVKWQQGEHKRTFGECIHDALIDKPECLFLDEIRSDEPESLIPLFVDADVKRQVWAFRAPANVKRLSASLGMLARRSNPAHGEDMVKALYNRLPFILTLRRSRQNLTLRSVAEWQTVEGAEYPSLIEIVEYDGEKPVLTGRRCMHDLDLTDDFWK